MDGSNTPSSVGLIPIQSLPFRIDVPYVVKGWFRKGQVAMVYGPSNVGKSFFVLDLMNHIASGRSWNGCRVQQGRVVYVACEGHSGIAQRIRALELSGRFTDDFQQDQFLLLPERIDLSNYDTAREFCDRFAEMDVDMIVIDTLATAVGDKSENETSTVNVILKGLEQLRAINDPSIVLVHHTGKDTSKGARGASAFRCSVDTEIALFKDRELITVQTTKQRDYANGAVLYFTLENVELGRDSDGDPVTSCVVQYTSKADRPAKLSDAKLIMLRGFETALTGAGFELHGHPDLPSKTRAVLKSDWKEAVLDDPQFSKGVQEDSRRRSFARNVKELEAEGYVGSNDNKCFWLLKKQDKNTE